MKWIACLLLFCTFANAQELSDLRKLYPQASANPSSATAFAEKAAAFDTSGHPVVAAYKAAALTLKSKFSKKLGEKISFFKDGANRLDEAISHDPDNVEMRMIRLSIQENVPAIVNYKRNKQEDTHFIYSHFQELSGGLREYIRNFILRSKSFSEQQKQAAKQ